MLPRERPQQLPKETYSRATMAARATIRVGYKEILATLFLKTIPLIAAVAIIYKYVTEHIEMDEYVSALAYAVFGLALFLAIRLTAWEMLRRLIREANPK